MQEALAARKGVEDPDTIPLSDIACPHCGTRGAWTEPREFNMMLRTHLGVVEDEAGLHYLREAMHMVFLTALPLAGIAFLATLFIKQIPLRETLAPVVADPEADEVPPTPTHAIERDEVELESERVWEDQAGSAGGSGPESPSSADEDVRPRRAVEEPAEVR